MNDIEWLQCIKWPGPSCDVHTYCSVAHAYISTEVKGWFYSCVVISVSFLKCYANLLHMYTLPQKLLMITMHDYVATTRIPQMKLIQPQSSNNTTIPFFQ